MIRTTLLLSYHNDGESLSGTQQHVRTTSRMNVT
ncbi:unnamed protein product [Amoebophrya sp. A120]|nr:unnamed protein product [Amoebophrya sp. A120]|eukprot:GSA120T00009954001.1